MPIIKTGPRGGRYVEKWTKSTGKYYKHYLTQKEIERIEGEKLNRTPRKYQMTRREIERVGKENWEEARNLDELCDAMVFSLRQKLETPWYAPTDSETEPVLDTLIKIAQTHEMFTIEGQPGICDDNERQRAYMDAFIATYILDEFIENLPGDIAIFIYDYLTKETEFINVNAEEKDWYSKNENIISLTTEYEHGVKIRDYTNFNIKRFKDQALDSMDFIPNDETIRILMGTSNDCFEDDLVSYITLIYHPKCKLELAEDVLEALYKLSHLKH
uniref:DUF6919 domain-containing protein n=1 Tax=Pithovirus LCPAC406 TaxID=2506599 RepID=A0A481ZG12_9VIRU|nr:MAG: hypothetical protein LCPAC406_01440 [Pithovirus LCPAC406]